MRLILDSLARQQGRLFLWLPVGYGAGIGGYFLQHTEPGMWCYGTITVGLMLCAWGTYRLPEGWRPLTIFAAICLAGFMLAGAQAHQVRAPVLDFRYYGPVEGRVIAVDRSQSDKPRLTLDQVVLRRMAPARTPKRVRISLHGEQPYLTPEAGQVVIMTAHLSPPQGPVEPGGFDFRRLAWFQGLGAVGYTRAPALVLAPPDDSPRWWIARLRGDIAQAIHHGMNDSAAAVAIAITTGDRSDLSQDTVEALRRTNLAHLLAISGLHMGLLVGFVFALMRYGLALWPRITLYWPTKKIAAGTALITGAAYLALSGGSVATMRAFVMVSVMLIAVMLDRRAITLRAVAVAALIILTLRPDSLLSPGFQMSFAATTALVAVFDELRRFDQNTLPSWVRPVITTVLSSAVAGLATAPYGAAHFNQISHFGLVANLLAVPVMGLVVMPAAVVSVVLWPFGAEAISLWAMEQGIVWILSVAGWISDWEGVVSHVVSPGAWGLPLLSMGLLICAIWQGAGRWVGVPIVMTAMVIWGGTGRPDVLIASSGGLVGMMGPEGRALSKARGDGFSARVWLENDGAPVDQADGFARPGFAADGNIMFAQLGDITIVHLTRSADFTRAAELCHPGTWIVSSAEMPELEGGCRVLDQIALRHSGARAVYLEGKEAKEITVTDLSGHRLWTGPPKPDQ